VLGPRRGVRKSRRLLSVDEYRRLFWAIVQRDLVETTLIPVCSAWALTALRLRRLRMLVGLTLMGECGLRVGECCALRWTSVRSVHDGEPVFTLPRDVAKGGRERLVVATPCLVWVLRWWMCALPELMEVVGGDFVLSLGGPGGRPSTRCLQKGVRAAALRHLGFPISPHTLRRTYGDRCRQAGDLRLAQLALGHAHLSSTERYVGGALHERCQLAARMAGELFPGGVPDVDYRAWVNKDPETREVVADV